jgi:hypothetical protein
MEENGQALEAPNDLEDLAKFLVDNPEGTDAQDDKPQNLDEPDKDNSDEPEDSPADDDSDEDDSEEAEEQKSGLKFKVPVKGEDGTDTSIEVDEKELIAGYQRHSDYTRKAMELANKEREAFKVVTSKIEESHNYFRQQAVLAQAAVRQLAGLRSPDEMASLAHTDPAEWVKEQQRERAISSVLRQIEGSVQQHEQQRVQFLNQQEQERIEASWKTLNAEKIDRDGLAKLYDTIGKKYGVKTEVFSSVVDAGLVLALFDAAKYQELVKQKAAVTKRADKAPQLPAQRQSVPRNEQKSQKLNARFNSGKAKLNDLAAYLEANNL